VEVHGGSRGGARTVSLHEAYDIYEATSESLYIGMGI